jgi:hypothetical protein
MELHLRYNRPFCEENQFPTELQTRGWPIGNGDEGSELSAGSLVSLRQRRSVHRSGVPQNGGQVRGHPVFLGERIPVWQRGRRKFLQISQAWGTEPKIFFTPNQSLPSWWPLTPTGTTANAHTLPTPGTPHKTQKQISADNLSVFLSTFLTMVHPRWFSRSWNLLSTAYRTSSAVNQFRKNDFNSSFLIGYSC